MRSPQPPSTLMADSTAHPGPGTVRECPDAGLQGAGRAAAPVMRERQRTATRSRQCERLLRALARVSAHARAAAPARNSAHASAALPAARSARPGTAAPPGPRCTSRRGRAPPSSGSASRSYRCSLYTCARGALSWPQHLYRAAHVHGPSCAGRPGASVHTRAQRGRGRRRGQHPRRLRAASAPAASSGACPARGRHAGDGRAAAGGARGSRARGPSARASSMETAMSTSASTRRAAAMRNRSASVRKATPRSASGPSIVCVCPAAARARI
jgi:hypothetical protein